MILFLFLPLELLLGPDHNLKTYSAILLFQTTKSHNFPIIRNPYYFFFSFSSVQGPTTQVGPLAYNRNRYSEGMDNGQKTPREHPDFNSYVKILHVFIFQMDGGMDRQTEKLIRCGLGNHTRCTWAGGIFLRYLRKVPRRVPIHALRVYCKNQVGNTRKQLVSLYKFSC